MPVRLPSVVVPVLLLPRSSDPVPVGWNDEAPVPPRINVELVEVTLPAVTVLVPAVPTFTAKLLAPSPKFKAPAVELIDTPEVASSVAVPPVEFNTKLPEPACMFVAADPLAVPKKSKLLAADNPMLIVRPAEPVPIVIAFVVLSVPNETVPLFISTVPLEVTPPVVATNPVPAVIVVPAETDPNGTVKLPFTIVLLIEFLVAILYHRYIAHRRQDNPQCVCSLANNSNRIALSR